MIRLILLAILIVSFLAIRYLPWWALVSLPLIFGVLLYQFAGKLFVMIFSIPFRLKGRVLRGAEVKVNSIRPIPAPPVKTNQDDEDDRDELTSTNDDVDYFELDVVILPKQTKGPFQLWEPDELRLVSRQSKWNSNDACSIIDLQVVSDPILDAERYEFVGITVPAECREIPTKPAVEEGRENNEAANTLLSRDEDDDDTDDEGNKFFGPQRIKLNIKVRRGVKKIEFCYYFERFGLVTV